MGRKKRNRFSPMCFPLSVRHLHNSASVREVTPPAVRPKRSTFIQPREPRLPARPPEVRPYGGR